MGGTTKPLGKGGEYKEGGRIEVNNLIYYRD